MTRCRTSTRTPRYSGPKVDFISCMRVIDLPVAYVPSVKSKCIDCGEEVWVSKKILAIVVAPSLCMECTKKKLAEED